MGSVFSRVRRGASYDLLRVVLGLILLLAAGLKTHQLATDPLVTLATRPSSVVPLASSLAPLLHSRPFLIGVVECELLFGLVLLSGILPRLTWALSLLCFGGFALIPLYKGISGEATCGCFGRVPVNPWYTFAIDATAVLALLRWRPHGQSRPCVPTFARLAEVLALWLLVGAPAALATWTEPAGTLTDLGEVLDNGRIVILKPETWVGKRLPLLDYVEIGDRLEKGDWVVLLFHHDCPNCQEVLARLPAIGTSAGADTAAQRALVELPPHGEIPLALLKRHPIVHTRLVDTREWLVQTPVVLLLGQGRVLQTVERDRLAGWYSRHVASMPSNGRSDER